MTKNKLLNAAIYICKFIKLIYILSFIAFTCIFIHFQIDRDYYIENNIQLSLTSTQSSEINFKHSDKWGDGIKKDNKEVYALDKMTTKSIYMIYLKLICVIVIMFLITKEFQNIIQSVKYSDTFKKGNIKSFSRIGKYTLLYFFLTSYSVIEFQEGKNTETHISFVPLFIALIAFIMAEIFKEGNVLMEESELTV